MGGKGGGSSTIKIRYAGYIEDRHKAFLNKVIEKRNATINDSPYSAVAAIDMDDGFFGVGYTLSSFPSLYDMYGKFLAGLDIDALYDQIYGDLMEGPVTRRLINAEADFLSDEIESDALPRLETGMRDINAVMSSSFVIAKALLEEHRLKAVEKYSAGLQYALLPLVNDRWRTHLEWNRGVITTYSEIIKLYITSKLDIDQQNQEVLAKNKLWPFTILDYERAALGALQGATNTKQVGGQGSAVGRALSGTVGGAASGAMVGAQMGSVGGPWGAAIGGILGLAGSIF
jgi:hypothetical protein